MVELGERFAELERNQAKHNKGPEGSSEQRLQQFDNVLLNLGLSSPVTKETAGMLSAQNSSSTVRFHLSQHKRFGVLF